MRADDVELNRIRLISQSASCTRSAYQSTELAAVATFGGAGLPDVADVDVSRLVSGFSEREVIGVGGKTQDEEVTEIELKGIDRSQCSIN